MIEKLLLVGGDRRMLRLVPLLRAKGYQVATWGLEAGDGGLETVRQADAVLFPYPYAVREGRVPAETGGGLSPEVILKNTKEQALVLAGKGLESYVLEENSRGRGLRLVLYERHEPFLQANAEISAEGAVYEAMGLTDARLSDHTVLLAGYGRFGRALGKRLRLLGATVWVAARREKQRLCASEDGLRALPLTCVHEIAPEVTLVLNTVPALVIPTQAMERLPKDCVLMELAGGCGGFDPAEAEKLGLRHLALPGIPGRYAPASAARALMEACEKLLTEAGI